MDEYIVERKKEAKVPAQARIDIRVLAALDEYWRSKGVVITSMSQLISWSMDLLYEVMSRNDELVAVFEEVADAHDHLIKRELYQSGMRERGSKKIMHAMMFDNLRMEGIEPQTYATRQYNTVHNKHSIESSGMGEQGHSSKQEKINRQVRQALSIMDEAKNKKLEDAKVETKKKLKEFKYDKDGVVILPKEGMSGGIYKKDMDKWNEEKAEQSKEKDNAPAESSNIPRAMTEEELDKKAREIERRDKEQAEALKKM